MTGISFQAFRDYAFTDNVNDKAKVQLSTDSEGRTSLVEKNRLGGLKANKQVKQAFVRAMENQFGRQAVSQYAGINTIETSRLSVADIKKAINKLENLNSKQILHANMLELKNKVMDDNGPIKAIAKKYMTYAP